MSSLRAQLEKLANTRPVEYDPEDADVGVEEDGVTRSFSARGAKAKAAGTEEFRPSKLRASAEFAADLEHHPKYQGKVVSVRSLADDQFGDDAQDDNEDDDDVVDESEDDEENDEDDASNDEDDDDDDDEEDAHDDSDDDDGGNGGEDSDVASDGYRAPQVRKTGDADADADAELRALAAADAAAMSRYRSRGDGDAAKGRHVRSQVEVVEATLEARIKMQKALTAGNALPRPEVHAAMCSSSSDMAAAFSSARGELVALLAQMLRLRATILARVPDIAAAVADTAEVDSDDATAVETALLPEGCPRRGNKRRRSEDDADDGDDDATDGVDEDAEDVAPLDLTSDAIWASIQRGWDASSAWRDSTLDSWGRRSAVASGLSLQATKLKVLGADLSTSVRQLLTDDKERLLARARLGQGSVRHMGEAVSSTSDGSVPSATGPDLDTYDDSELYAALLKEYVSSTAATEQAVEGARAAAAVAGSKAGYKRVKREGLDRKGSKDRRLKYVVHPKLVAFAAPAPFVVPPELAYDVDLVVNSLFRG